MELQVEVKPHPRGEEGTRISLEEAASAAAAARIDPRVRAWAIEKIVQAGNPEAIVDRAQALLYALRKERIYIEDPFDAEFMPSSACTLVGCKGLKFLGEDCDGLLIAWLGACGSIGIGTAVVGHSYDKSGQLSHVLSHVLGAVWDGKGRWYRGDPSTKQAFGTVSHPTRERWIAVHDGRVLCDKINGCNANQVEDPLKVMRPSAEFVGVLGAPHQGTVGTGEVELSLGDTSQQAAWREQIKQAQTQLYSAVYDVSVEHEKLVVLREYFNRPIVDMDIVQSGYVSDVSPDAVWSQADENDYQRTRKTAELTLRYGQEAISGQRHVAQRSDNGEIVILGDPNEKVVQVEGSKISSSPVSGSQYVQLAGTVGTPVQIAIVIAGALYLVLVGYGVYSAFHDVVGAYNHTLQTVQLQELKKFYNERIAAGDSPEQAASAVNVVSDAVAKTAKANVDAEQASPMNKFLDTAKTVMWAGLGIGVLVAGGYALMQLVPLLKLRSKTAG